MPASKAQQKAVAKYMKNNYDTFQLRMPKGKKDEIKAAADQEGKSVNAYIIEAIDEKMSGASSAPPSDPDRQQEQDSSETD